MTKIIYILLFAFLFIFIFKNLFSTYFQQDEWHAFGIILSDNFGYVTMHQSLFQLLFSADRAGARFLMYILFSTFGFNVFPYFFLSLGLHCLNSLLVYKIAKQILKDKKIAFTALLFFLFSGVASQSYTWLGTFAGTVPNMSFLLLSLYFYLRFLGDEKKKFFIYFSLILLWVSFLFKESGFFFLIFYPVLYYLRSKKLFLSIKINFLFLIYGLLLFFFRINELLTPKGDAVNVVTSRTGISEIFLNLAIYPLESFSQLIFPPNIIYTLSQFFASVFLSITPNTTEVDLLSQSKIAPILSILFTLVILLLIYKLLIKKYKSLQENSSFAINFCIIYIFLSFLPYAIIQKTDAFFEPRYYYNGTLASSILLSMLLFAFWKSKKELFRTLVLVLFTFLFYFNISAIRDDINFQKEAAVERKYIIRTIQDKVPTLPKKVIFYVSGDSIGYYGLPELKVPFQSGIGHVLLTTYIYKKQIASQFLLENSIIKTEGEGFLYNILGQGYREIDGGGFGYFWDKKEMMDAIKKNNLSLTSVRAFFYKSEKHELIEVKL